MTFCRTLIEDVGKMTTQFAKQKATQASSFPHTNKHSHITNMAPIALTELVSALPSDSIWGPPTTSETLVNGVPYAPYSKGDKLGRMADWTNEGKDREGRRGQQFNRAYRGEIFSRTQSQALMKSYQISKSMVPERRAYSLYNLRKMNPPFLW